MITAALQIDLMCFFNIFQAPYNFHSTVACFSTLESIVKCSKISDIFVI